MSQECAGQPASGGPVPPVPPVPTHTDAPLVPPRRRPTNCSVCHIVLPKTATTDICEECNDPARQPATPPPDRPLRVVHDGTTDRRTICPYCCDPLHYDDDRSHGYHTSRTKCVNEHKKNVA